LVPLASGDLLVLNSLVALFAGADAAMDEGRFEMARVEDCHLSVENGRLVELLGSTFGLRFAF